MSAVLASHRRTIKVVSCLVAFVVFGGALSACTSPKDVLGTNSSPCFRALATADVAVPAGSRFAGVRYLSAASFKSDLVHDKRNYDVPPALVSNKSPICVVAYVGRFSAALVKKPWPANVAAGRIAVVLITAKLNGLLATIVLQKPPLRLSRVFPLTR